jgi:hypothetical protein
MSTSGCAMALLSLSPALVAVDSTFNDAANNEPLRVTREPRILVEALQYLNTIKTSFVNDNGKCLYPGPSLPIDLHRIEVMPLSRSTDHSRFVNGIVLDHGARHPDMPDLLQNCKIMTLNPSLEYEKKETQSGVFSCKQIIDMKRRLKDSGSKNAFVSIGTHELAEQLVTLHRIDMTHETINVIRVNESRKFPRHRQRFRCYAITAHTLPRTMDMQQLSKSRHPSGLVRKPVASTTTSSLRSSLSESAGIPMAANLILPSGKSESLRGRA